MTLASSSTTVKRQPPLLPSQMPTTQAAWTQFSNAMQEWFQSLQSAQSAPNVLPAQYSVAETAAVPPYTPTNCTVAQDSAHALYAAQSLKVSATADGATLSFAGYPIAIQPNQLWYCAFQVWGSDFEGSLSLKTSAGTIVSSGLASTTVDGWSLVWTLLDLTAYPDTQATWTITFTYPGNYWLDGLQMSPAGKPFLAQPPFVVGTGSTPSGSVVTATIPPGSITGGVGGDIAPVTVTAVNIAPLTITALQIAPVAITAAQIAPLTITYAQIAPLTITAAEIANNTITSGQIYENTITAGQIAANTITAGQIAASTITSAQIEAGSIEGDSIAANTLTAGNIAANTITSAQIAAYSILALNIASNSITSLQIAANTILGNNIAAETIEGSNIAANTIALNIATNAIETDNITSLAVTADKIAANSITSVQIAADTITSGQIAASTITGSNIAAGTITATNLAANSVTAANIAAGTITGSQIAGGTITGSNIQAATITGSELSAGTITATQIAAATIAGANLVSGTITALQIAAGTITSAQLNVTSLSALSADLGTITEGTVIFDNGTYMRVMGIGFGASSNLLDWYGPHLSSISLCSESNAIFYQDISGKSYHGGYINFQTGSAASGNYIKFPADASGRVYIWQFGTTAATGSDPSGVTFPVAYDIACLSVVANPVYSGGGGLPATVLDGSPTTMGFEVYSGGFGYTWQAIGY